MSLRLACVIPVIALLILHVVGNIQRVRTTKFPRMYNEFDGQEEQTSNWENVSGNQERDIEQLTNEVYKTPPSCPPPPKCPTIPPRPKCRRPCPLSCKNTSQKPLPQRTSAALRMLPLKNTPTPKPLPKGYIKLPNLPNAYRFHTKADDWYGAKERCEKQGAYLAVPNSIEEAQALVDMLLKESSKITNLKYNKVNKSLNHMHLGIHRSGEHWVTVENPPRPLEKTGYVSWIRKPDLDRNEEDCVQLYSDLTYNDYYCTRRLAFACELPLL